MNMNADGRELGAPSASHQFDERSLHDYLRGQVDGYQGGGDVQQFLGGQSNPTFRIDDASGTYVLRKKPPGKLLPSAHAVDREYRVISALGNTNVPVPEAVLLCEDDAVIGQMFYLMKYVAGRVIPLPSLPDCEPKERGALYHSMASVLGQLHSVDYKEVGLESFGKPTQYVARQVARWSGQYEASKMEECPEMDRLIAWLPENDPGDADPAIVHGDFRPGNLIFDNERPEVVAVLDWELSTIGHPLADLGYFLSAQYLDAKLLPDGLGGLNTRAMGIPSIKELSQTYAEHAGLNSAPEVGYYVAFSLFRLAAILAGVLRRGMDGNAADPRAIERGKLYRAIADAGWTVAATV